MDPNRTRLALAHDGLDSARVEAAWRPPRRPVAAVAAVAAAGAASAVAGASVREREQKVAVAAQPCDTLGAVRPVRARLAERRVVGIRSDVERVARVGRQQDVPLRAAHHRDEVASIVEVRLRSIGAQAGAH